MNEDATTAAVPHSGNHPVVLITGAARGIGRSCALRFASGGFDVVLVDVCADQEGVAYAMAADQDLADTAEAVHALGRRALAFRADVRDSVALDAAVKQTVSRFGRLDAAVCNAGISSFGKVWELSDDDWSSGIDVMLSGAWRTAKAVLPALIEGARGGCVTFVGSALSLKGAPGAAQYVSAKHGLVGLMRAIALEGAEHSIRSNLVAPGSVGTRMALNDTILRRHRPDLAAPTSEDARESMQSRHALPVAWIDPEDVAHAVHWLSSDEARFVTGATLPVDAGWTTK